MRKDVFKKLVANLLGSRPADLNILEGKAMSRKTADELFHNCHEIFFEGGHAHCGLDYEIKTDGLHPIVDCHKKNHRFSAINYKERHLRFYIISMVDRLKKSIETTIGLNYLNTLSVNGKQIYYYQKEIPLIPLKGRGDARHRLIKAIDKYLRLFPESHCYKDFAFIVDSLRDKSLANKVIDLIRWDSEIMYKQTVWESCVRTRIINDLDYYLAGSKVSSLELNKKGA